MHVYIWSRLSKQDRPQQSSKKHIQWKVTSPNNIFLFVESVKKNCALFGGLKQRMAFHQNITVTPTAIGLQRGNIYAREY